jgi:hypothetical protein
LIRRKLAGQPLFYFGVYILKKTVKNAARAVTMSVVAWRPRALVGNPKRKVRAEEHAEGSGSGKGKKPSKDEEQTEPAGGSGSGQGGKPFKRGTILQNEYGIAPAVKRKWQRAWRFCVGDCVQDLTKFFKPQKNQPKRFVTSFFVQALDKILEEHHQLLDELKQKKGKKIPPCRVSINGNRNEYYMNEENEGLKIKKSRLLPYIDQVLTDGEGSETYGSIWKDFMNALKENIRDRLKEVPFHFDDERAKAIVFSGESIIVSQPGCPAQWPHVDNVCGGQAVVALSNKVPSTLVYDGKYVTAEELNVHRTPDETKVWEQDKLVLKDMTRSEYFDAISTVVSKTRADFDNHMKGFTRNLNAGEYSLAVGPVVHAGPATVSKAVDKNAAPRAVLFISFTDPQIKQYDPDFQAGPTRAAVDFNSAELIAEKFHDFKMYNPLDQQPEGSLKEILSRMPEPPYADNSEFIALLRREYTEKCHQMKTKTTLTTTTAMRRT